MAKTKWDASNKKRKNYFAKPYHFDTKKKKSGDPAKKKQHIFSITGSIKQYGYATSKSSRSRRIALGKGVKKEGAKVIWGRLHTQVLYRKNARKGTTKYRNLLKFKSDREWLKTNYPWVKKGGKK